MKILLITGSPREGGASSILAGAFEKGALAAGHEVFRFDAGLKKVAPCSVCEYCHTEGDRCIIRDDMDGLVPHLLDSERAQWGAVQNRLTSTISNQSNPITNVSDARSRIQDVDFASETASMTQQNVIQQAATSVLSQANSSTQIALSLLG